MITIQHQNSFIKKIKLSLSNAPAENDYPGIYLSYLMSHLEYFVQVYSVVLNRGLQLADVAINQARLVDLGAGNGMLGFFAKFCGFKEVYINDIDKTFIEASKKLSSTLSIFPNGFIEGDIINVYNFFKDAITPDIVAGTDMIEHVYDLDTFTDTLFSLKDTKAFVFTTASNPVNYFKVRQLRKIQYNDEYVGGYPGEYLLYGAEAMRPFLEIRKEIIQQKFPTLAAATTNELALKTRGLIKADIETAVQQFIESGVMPSLPKDPYNTCNPMNGSWSERIISLQEYRKLFSNQGASLEISPGLYNGTGTNLKSKLLRIINLLIPVVGLSIAPYMMLSAAKKE